MRLKRSVGALVGATFAVVLAALMLVLFPAVAEAQTKNKSTPSIVVRPGDSLWSISEERLGQNATPQQIYNKAARIYALNSERIGENPNLIYPGEVLLLEPAREPVDAPAVADRPGRDAHPADSERASKKVAAPTPSRDTAQRTSRDLAREPSKAPKHPPPKLARAPIPKLVGEPAPKAASDDERWLPQGRLLLAALAGTAIVWGAMGLILVVALVARKLPTNRTTRSNAERRGMPNPYYGAEAAYRNVPFAYHPGSLGEGDTRDARKRAQQAPEALGHKPNGDASAGSRVRKAAAAGRGRTRRAKKVRELALIVVLAACAYATVILLNAHERFERWASSYEKWQLDELLILLGFVAMAALVFAWRRWREANAELARRKDLHRKLEHRATHDGLTDLPNRAMFMDRLQHAIERAKREQTMVAVLFIDLDDFKAVNDALGHAGGDQLLKQLARRLRRCTRSADTVSRIGGDEFVVLLEDVKDVHQDVVTVVRRIAKSLGDPYDLERGVVSVGSSIGVALNEIEIRAAEDFLREADNAMYRVKGRTKHATRR